MTDSGMMEEDITQMQSSAPSLSMGLLQLREDKLFTDVTLACQSTTVSAHKCVLAARSLFFKHLFKQAGDTCIYVNLTSYLDGPDILRLVVDFLYTGSIPLSLKHLVPVSNAAEYLAVDDLIQICSDYLAQTLNEDNCLRLYLDLMRSQGHVTHPRSNEEGESLIEMTWDMLEEQFYDHVLQHEEMLKVSTEDVVHIMSRGIQKRFSVLKVFTFLLQWLTYRPGEGEVVDLFLSLVLERLQLSSQLHQHTAGAIGPILSLILSLHSAICLSNIHSDQRKSIIDKLQALTDLVKSADLSFVELPGKSATDFCAVGDELGQTVVDTSGKKNGDTCMLDKLAERKPTSLNDTNLERIVGDEVELCTGNNDVKLNSLANDTVQEHTGGEKVVDDVITSTEVCTGDINGDKKPETLPDVIEKRCIGNSDVTCEVKNDVIEDSLNTEEIDDISNNSQTSTAVASQKMLTDDGIIETIQDDECVNMVEDIGKVARQIKVEIAEASFSTAYGVSLDRQETHEPDDHTGNQYLVKDQGKMFSESTILARVKDFMQKLLLVETKTEKRKRGRPPKNKNVDKSVEKESGSESDKALSHIKIETDNKNDEIDFTSLQSTSRNTRMRRKGVKRKFYSEDDSKQTATGISKPKSMRKERITTVFRIPVGKSKTPVRVSSIDTQKDGYVGDRGMSEEEEKQLLMKNLYLRSGNEPDGGDEVIDNEEESGDYEDYHVEDLDFVKPSKSSELKKCNKQIQCTECPKIFQSSYKLKRHMFVHGAEKEYSCVVCGLLFGRGYHLIRHLRSVHSDMEEFTCPLCARRLNDPKAVVAHCRDHIEAKKGKLPLKSTSKEGGMADKNDPKADLSDRAVIYYTERSTDEGKKEFECSVCSVTFAEEHQAQEHLSEHSDASQEDLMCIECGENFGNKELLKRHVDEQHNKDGTCTYLCKSCNKEYLEHSVYLIHVRTCQKGFKCDQCPAGFRSMYHLKRHQKVHSQGQPRNHGSWKCPECIEKFNTTDLLAQHMKDVHNMVEANSYTCAKCQKEYTSAVKYLVHICSCQRGFKCDKCPASFGSQYHLNRHQTVHVSVPTHSCTQCTKMYKTKQKLNEHMKAEHDTSPESTNVICELCGMVLKNIRYLRRHLNTHKGIKLHQCKICLKSYTQSSGLQVHMRMHTGARPFQCEICSMLFAVKSNLMRHQRRHRGERRYSCDQCGKGFLMMSDLRRHYTMHTGEKKYPCKYCGKCFSTKSKLPQHERIHTGEKPYECRICNKRFIQNGDRKRHELTHHSGAVNPFEPRKTLYEIANGTTDNDVENDKGTASGSAGTEVTAAMDKADFNIEESTEDCEPFEKSITGVNSQVTSFQDEEARNKLGVETLHAGQAITSEGMEVKTSQDIIAHLPDGQAVIAKLSFPSGQFF